MRHTGLFNGIGGFMLAAEWMGWENVDSVEIDPWCNKIIEKNFPNVNRYYDIKEYKGERDSADIISAGVPCQPASIAGKRKGKDDDRWLWDEFIRVIREIKPTYIVCENVTGLISLDDGKALEGIFTDLEGEGYTIESFIIPACGVGVWHRRDRIWIIAYNDSFKWGANKRESNTRTNGRNDTTGLRKDVSNTHKSGLQAGQLDRSEIQGSSRKRRNATNNNPTVTVGDRDVSNPEQQRCGQVEQSVKTGTQKQGTTIKTPHGSFTRGGQGWSTEPNVGRVANGIPRRVDRLKGLGNAIVPQVAYEIFKVIDQL